MIWEPRIYTEWLESIKLIFKAIQSSDVKILFQLKVYKQVHSCQIMLGMTESKGNILCHHDSRNPCTFCQVSYVWQKPHDP